MLSRAVIAATGVTLLVGLAGVPAQAAPENTKTAAAEAAAVPEATLEDKVRAAAVLGIVAGDDLLVLNDRNFVIALWRKATGSEVRASAELAFSGSDAECTQWIKTGIHEAKKRDDVNEIRDAELAKQARELKQRAAAVIGISAGDDLLILSYKDFVYALWERATGPKVKAAALAAFGKDEAAQKEFLRNGILVAREQDEKDKAEQDHEHTEAEKARLAAREAKSRAASVLGIVATENLLILPDDNFVREIWNRAKPGTEVAAAAERALRSPNPADWKAFIDTGIYDASKRDNAIELQKKAAADRKRLEELKVRAENSKVHPTLVAAATRMLASGTVDEIDHFLRIGQTEDAVLRQSLQADTLGSRGSYIRGQQGSQAIIAFGNAAPVPGEGADATWKVVPGLADIDCHSFESVTKPGTYLRQLDYKVLIAPSDGTPRFYNDATWCSKPGLEPNGVSLESKSAPGRFLRHYGGLLYAADRSGAHPYDAAHLFEIDSFWRVHGENPTTSAIARRWLNDDYIRGRVGDAVAEEKADGDVRYRDYKNGRLTWTKEIGVKEIEGAIFARYQEQNLLKNDNYGPPVTDETGTPDGRGRYNHFKGGGSIYWTSATDAHLVYGAIKDRWRTLDWERSYLGYPTSDEFAVPEGRRNCFEHGSITFNATTLAVTDVRGACTPPAK
ncbi:hypothetical protein GCM10023192_87020 [Amycolatopsis samaneae]